MYNTCNYLCACIDSVLSQDFSEFECILVDDGSTDGSGLICDSYSNKDSRIKVFHKENGGVSSARNYGLDHALGEWIYFIDSDDEILPGGLQTLIRSISDDVDVVVGGYEWYGTNGEIIETIKDKVSLTLSKEESLLMLFSSHPRYYSYLGFMWMWMFRRSIIEDNKLRFDTSIKIKEDTLFVTQYLCLSNGRARFNTTPVYKYKMRENSAMGNLEVKYCPDYLTSLDAVIRMHDCIHKIPQISKTLSNAAKYEVVNRVYMIRGQMIRFHAYDSGIVSSMTRVTIKEVGLPYYLSYQYRRYRRRVKRLIKRILKQK